MKLSRMLVLGTALVFVCRVAGAADQPRWRNQSAPESRKRLVCSRNGPKMGRNSFGRRATSAPATRLRQSWATGCTSSVTRGCKTKACSSGRQRRQPDLVPADRQSGRQPRSTVSGSPLDSDGRWRCAVCPGLRRRPRLPDHRQGEVRWHKSLRDDFGGSPGQWAYSESPLVDGDVLVCTPGGKTATIVALDKKSGEPIWKSPILGGDQAAYASAIVLTAGGVKQYVQFLQRRLVGVDAKTGKFLWRWTRRPRVVPPTFRLQSPIRTSCTARQAVGAAA